MYKRRAVINAAAADLERAEALVEQGRYRSLSEFMREAMAEKLARLDDLRVAEQVERYCAIDDGDDELIGAQAFDDAEPARRSKRSKTREAG